MVMFPGTTVPRSLQEALGLRRADATQAAIAAMPQHVSSELRLFQQTDPVIQELLRFWNVQRRPSREKRSQLSQFTLVLLHQWERLGWGLVPESVTPRWR